MAVSPAAASAVTQHKILSVRHIVEDLFGFRVAQDRPTRHKDHNILAVFAVEFRPAAVSAVFRHEFALVPEREQGIRPLVHTENDISAASAVAAVRSALGDVFFTP